MNQVLAAVSVAALALIAAAGVVAGYRRRPVPLEAPVDPLEERRRTLLRSLADLDEARATGALVDPEYERLRSETEGRLAGLLRAIDRRERLGGTAPVESGRPGRIPVWAVATLLVATAGAVAVAGLIDNAEPSPAPSPAASDDPFAFFESRVRDHPRDIAARLDLARRYLDALRLEDALAEYTVALELNPTDAEAHAHVGLILFLSDRPEDALAEVDRALETAPDYPEALLYRGLILLRGLDRSAEAIESLEAYRDAAPFGAERETAEELIAQAERALAGG
ncbi:MAG TPA: tetratricopeptide repeat protein [Actinomycetota bacterium]|nr:tetratricopeptide repeat protein [Actinomycetota bacterium]